MDLAETRKEWLVTGRSDSNKWQHSEPRLRSARGQARGRDEDPGRGHPVLAGPAHQLLGPGQAYHLHSRYPYIHTTQPCYSLINSRLLTKKALKISLFSLNHRQMESRIYPPMLKSLGLQCTAEMDFLHTCKCEFNLLTVDKFNFRSNLNVNTFISTFLNLGSQRRRFTIKGHWLSVFKTYHSNVTFTKYY